MRRDSPSAFPTPRQYTPIMLSGASSAGVKSREKHSEQAGGPLIRSALIREKLCPVHRSLIAMSGRAPDHDLSGWVPQTPEPPAKAFAPPESRRADPLPPRTCQPPRVPPSMRIQFIPNHLFNLLTLQIISSGSLHWFQAEEVSMRLGGAVSPG